LFKQNILQYLKNGNIYVSLKGYIYITDSAMKTKVKDKLQEHRVLTAIQRCLKYAADQRGGGGIKKAAGIITFCDEQVTFVRLRVCVCICVDCIDQFHPLLMYISCYEWYSFRFTAYGPGH